MLELERVSTALAAQGIRPDGSQQAAIAAMLAMLGHLAGQRDGWWNRRTPVRGVYCYGPPGRGKSIVVDTVFSLAPCAKRRIHFHDFMREMMRRQMETVDTAGDVLVTATRQWLDGVALLCFDEFHVHDIADAFLVGRFLDTALAMGIAVVLTSNYAPNQLLPDPQFHARFLPTIARLERDFTVVHFDGALDYRLHAAHAAQRHFFAPLNAATAAALLRQYRHAEGGALPAPALARLAGRNLTARACGQRLLWADFAALCVESRSHLDYLALAERWQGLIVDQLSLAALANANTLQRFIWLVDILYDRKHLLVVASDQPLIAGIVDIDGAHDLSRMVSRLTEMQSRASALAAPLEAAIPEPVLATPQTSLDACRPDLHDGRIKIRRQR